MSRTPGGIGPSSIHLSPFQRLCPRLTPNESRAPTPGTRIRASIVTGGSEAFSTRRTPDRTPIRRFPKPCTVKRIVCRLLALAPVFALVTIGLRMRHDPHRSPASERRASVRSAPVVTPTAATDRVDDSSRNETWAAAQGDPDTAARELAAVWVDGPMPSGQSAQVVQRLRQWAALSPEAAWRWARQHAGVGNDDDRQSLTAVVLQTVAQQAPSTAIAWVDEQLRAAPPPTDAPDLAAELCAALLGANRASDAQRCLRAWADTPAGANLGASPLTNVGLYVAAHDSPQAAIDWLASFPAGTARDAALAAVAAEWTQHNATSALSWALRADRSGTSAQPVIGAWAQRDTVAAAEWLQEHEATPQADALIRGFIFHSSLAADAPIAATAWASLIQDPHLRRQSLAALGQRYSSP